MKKRKHLLEKLFLKELYGKVKESRYSQEHRIFHQLPRRLAFPLSAIVPQGALTTGHIFLGFTKCGQFVLSYTFSHDTDDNTMALCKRYRLHWWLFTPYSRLRKVAEVSLFGEQNVQGFCENVFISVCQWPNDLSKVLVYGSSLYRDSDGSIAPQTRRIYLTVTAVPSLNNCSACYQVASSYEEDEVAERWNSCVRFSCLKHGMTAHTSFEMVPTFPKFIPKIQMKIENHVVLNAGNFIHILSFDFENCTDKLCDKDANLSGSSAKMEYDFKAQVGSEYETCSKYDGATSVCDNESANAFNSSDNSNEQAKFSISSDSCLNRDKEWEVLIRGCHKSPYTKIHESTRDAISNPDKMESKSEVPSCSYDTNLASLKFSDLKVGGAKSALTNEDSSNVDSDDSALIQDSTNHESTLFQKPNSVFYDDASLIYNGCLKKSAQYFNRKKVVESFASKLDNNYRNQLENNSKTKKAEKEYEFIDEISEDQHEKLSVFRRRRLAEKRYEFSDENSENVPKNYCSFRSQKRRHLILSPARSPRSPRFRSLNYVPFHSDLTVELFDNSDLFKSVYEKILSPSGSASPNDVLKPINQNISSPIMSPRDDAERSEKNEMQRWSSRESLQSMLYSPVSTQRYPGDSTCQNTSASTPQENLKFIVDIKRRYIEVDDELVSIITDVEEDELSSATGYHNALPLEVHGSGYSQMHMISNAKAEKLMAPGVLIRQLSLDVEQFCHEAAQKLCNEAGKKYFFLNDYNIEIIDVCPRTKTVVALAMFLIEAATNAQKHLGFGKSFRSSGNVYTHCQPNRKLYRGSSTFMLDIESKTYSWLAKEALVEDDPYRLDDTTSVMSGESGEENLLWWQSARIEALLLRSKAVIPTDYYSSIKVMTNEAVLKDESLTHLIEGHHLVAIVMDRTSEN